MFSKQIIIAFKLLAISIFATGCAESLGIGYPDLYKVSKISKNTLSKEQKEQQIRQLQKDVKTHKQETIDAIKTGQ